jgi:hypothetical protein
VCRFYTHTDTHTHTYKRTHTPELLWILVSEVGSGTKPPWISRVLGVCIFKKIPHMNVSKNMHFYTILAVLHLDFFQLVTIFKYVLRIAFNK